MDDLIEALTIFRKYTDAHAPLCCEHDELFVLVDVDKVLPKDRVRLEQLSFTPNDNGTFSSFRFGSA
jgi:hypothetical protein